MVPFERETITFCGYFHVIKKIELINIQKQSSPRLRPSKTASESKPIKSVSNSTTLTLDTAPSDLVLLLSMNFVFPAGGWLETGVRAPSLVAEVFSRGTWCVFTTCRTVHSFTPGTSTATGPNLLRSWAVKVVCASACGRLQSGPRYSSLTQHSVTEPRGCSVHARGCTVQ